MTTHLSNPKPIQKAIDTGNTSFFVELVNDLLKPLYVRLCDCDCQSPYLFYHETNCKYRRTANRIINQTDRRVNPPKFVNRVTNGR